MAGTRDETHGAGVDAPEAAPSIALPEAAWLGSFESGLYEDEQLWLISASGEPVSVMDPTVPQSDTVSGTSTFGYLDHTGQISETVFDVPTERVIVTSIEESKTVTRALDLRTGRWSQLRPSTLRSTRRGPVLLSLEDGMLSLTTQDDSGAFETVATIDFPPQAFLSQIDAHRFRFRDKERLILVTNGNGATIASFGEFVRFDAGWMASGSLLPSGVETAYFEVTESGEGACAVGVDESGWILDGSLGVRVETPFAVRRCSFSPDGSRVVFSGLRGVGVRITDPVGTALADFERLDLQANHGGFGYGTARGAFVRLDWSTLELEALPSPAWCPGEDDEGSAGAPTVHIVGAAALVESSCPTIDSHFSGVFLLPLADDAVPRRLIEPNGWDILQIATLSDGSALIAQLPAGGEYLPNAGDRFLRVTTDGSVEELGPFSDMPAPLHAPVGNVALER